MVVGVLAARRLAYGFAGLALFACLGIAAAVTRHGASPGYALPTVFGALAGAFALYRLIEAAQAMTAAPAVERAPGPGGARPRRRRAQTPCRRSFSGSPAAGPTTTDEPSGPAATDRPTSPTTTDELRAPDLPRGAGRRGAGGTRPVARRGRARPVAGPARSFADRRAGPAPARAGAGTGLRGGRAGRHRVRRPAHVPGDGGRDGGRRGHRRGRRAQPRHPQERLRRAGGDPVPQGRRARAAAARPG